MRVMTKQEASEILKEHGEISTVEILLKHEFSLAHSVLIENTSGEYDAFMTRRDGNTLHENFMRIQYDLPKANKEAFEKAIADIVADTTSELVTLITEVQQFQRAEHKAKFVPATY